jgi:hypothetical protein
VYSSKGKLDIRLVVTVGMPATIGFYSDSHPGTVIEVKRNPKGEYKTIVVQEDNSKRSDDNGMSESQSYTYTRNPEGAKYTWTLRKNGRYVEKGRDIGQGVHLGLGYRRKYYDFSF